MHELDIVREARRQLEICNACRYCEGYCAVFPALERHTEVAASTIGYLAHLCHDCRACLYACPFAEPHEFALNLPRALAAVRAETYGSLTPTGLIRGLLPADVRTGVVATCLAVVAWLCFVLVTSGPRGLTATVVGPGAFYEVVPWLAMVIPGLALALYVVVALAVGALRFLRDTGVPRRSLFDAEALLTASWEALTLRWLGGGGDGCHYPTYRSSPVRLVLHTLVAGGFVLAFISTLIAAVYQDLLGLLPPYPLLSLPVLIGSAGGVAMIVGCVGFLAIRVRDDPAARDGVQTELGLAFLMDLGVASLTGMLLLAFRDTAAMGVLLVLHLGSLAVLYLTAPYGKFAHFLYRYLALVRNAVETRRNGAMD